MLINNQQVTLRCGNQVLDLTTPIVMGILNVTPDSFYKPSQVHGTLQIAIDLAGKMISEGALILDVGGMSTRPGAEEIPESEEVDRVIPVLEALRKHFPEIVLSIDTYRAVVTRQGINAGATLINDISGGRLDEGLLDVVAQNNVAYVMMHMRGKPADMQLHTDYKDLMGDLVEYFINEIRVLHGKGIREIILDPGFGFAKTMKQNYQLIDQLATFGFLDCPVMVGVSRKSTLAKTIGGTAEETLAATTALHAIALKNGASILRVHEVKPAMDVIAVHEQIKSVNTLNNKRLHQI